MLKKLINFLYSSRQRIRSLEKALDALTIIIEGLEEADANHSQIEMSLIQEVQKSKGTKPINKKNSSNPSNMYG